MPGDLIFLGYAEMGVPKTTLKFKILLEDS